MSNKYAAMTDDDFNRILVEVVGREKSGTALLSIPGIYEILSEYFNNEVLDRWEVEQAENAEVEQ